MRWLFFSQNLKNERHNRLGNIQDMLYFETYLFSSCWEWAVSYLEKDFLMIYFLMHKWCFYCQLPNLRAIFREGNYSKDTAQPKDDPSSFYQYWFFWIAKNNSRIAVLPFQPAIRILFIGECLNLRKTILCRSKLLDIHILTIFLSFSNHPSLITQFSLIFH